jgi:hypothetical protein
MTKPRLKALSVARHLSNLGFSSFRGSGIGYICTGSSRLGLLVEYGESIQGRNKDEHSAHIVKKLNEMQSGLEKVGYIVERKDEWGAGPILRVTGVRS